jgi:hypothetical protein
MKILLTVSAVVEASAGVALVLWPQLAIGLLLGSPLDAPMGLTLARGIGVALVCLGLAYWLARTDGRSRAARGLVTAMLLYNAAFAVLLAHARFGPGLSGVGLWPTVLLHLALAVWCIARLRLEPVPQVEPPASAAS